MIILKRKSIIFWVIIIIFITTIFLIADYNKIKTVETSVWSKTGKVVIVDAGHRTPGQRSG